MLARNIADSFSVMKVSRKPVFESSDFYSALGTKIRQVRLRNGLLQRQIGGLIDLSRPSVGLLEQGKYRLSLHDAGILAKLLGFSLDDLLPSLHVTAPRSWIREKLEKHERLELGRKRTRNALNQRT